MRSWARAAVVAAAVAVVAGCGGQSSTPGAAPGSAPTRPSGSGSKIVLASVETTAAAKSAHVSMSVSATGLGSQAFTLTGDGAIDFANGDSRLTMRFGGAAASLLPGGIEERSVGHVVYVELPGLTGAAHWVAVDAGKLGSSSSAVPGLGESDPTQFLASLETVSDRVDKVGTEIVRGVETTHYRATLDLRKAIDQAGVPQSLRDAEQQFLGSNGDQTPSIPVDVWIGADGYVRRISLDLDLGAFGAPGIGGSGAGSPAVIVSIDLYDFGTPVDVQAPPADQISRLSDFGLNGSGPPSLAAG
jgi:hypothetical protein